MNSFIRDKAYVDLMLICCQDLANVVNVSTHLSKFGIRLVWHLGAVMDEVHFYIRRSSCLTEVQYSIYTIYIYFFTVTSNIMLITTNIYHQWLALMAFSACSFAAFRRSVLTLQLTLVNFRDILGLPKDGMVLLRDRDPDISPSRSKYRKNPKFNSN